MIAVAELMPVKCALCARHFLDHSHLFAGTGDAALERVKQFYEAFHLHANHDHGEPPEEPHHVR